VVAAAAAVVFYVLGTTPPSDPSRALSRRGGDKVRLEIITTTAAVATADRPSTPSTTSSEQHLTVAVSRDTCRITNNNYYSYKSNTQKKQKTNKIIIFRGVLREILVRSRVETGRRENERRSHREKTK